MNSTQAIVESYFRHTEPLVEPHVNALDSILEGLGESLEGNCFYHGNTNLTSWFFVFKRINFVNVIKDHSVKKMIEIGFNAGHSALLFLSALPQDGTLLAFDLNDHTYAKPCFAYLKDQFPQLTKFIAGDSKQTLKEYILQNPSEIGTFDCIHVDGGHDKETAFSDVQHSDLLLRKGGILILDDTQLNDILDIVPALLNQGYSFLYQIPTYGFSHVCMMKN